MWFDKSPCMAPDGATRASIEQDLGSSVACLFVALPSNTNVYSVDRIARALPLSDRPYVSVNLETPSGQLYHWGVVTTTHCMLASTTQHRTAHGNPSVQFQRSEFRPLQLDLEEEAQSIPLYSVLDVESEVPLSVEQYERIYLARMQQYIQPTEDFTILMDREAERFDRISYRGLLTILQWELRPVHTRMKPIRAEYMKLYAERAQLAARRVRNEREEREMDLKLASLRKQFEPLHAYLNKVADAWLEAEKRLCHFRVTFPHAHNVYPEHGGPRKVRVDGVLVDEILTEEDRKMMHAAYMAEQQRRMPFGLPVEERQERILNAFQMSKALLHFYPASFEEDTSALATYARSSHALLHKGWLFVRPVLAGAIVMDRATKQSRRNLMYRRVADHPLLRPPFPMHEMMMQRVLPRLLKLLVGHACLPPSLPASRTRASLADVKPKKPASALSSKGVAELQHPESIPDIEELLSLSPPCMAALHKKAFTKIPGVNPLSKEGHLTHAERLVFYEYLVRNGVDTDKAVQGMEERMSGVQGYEISQIKTAMKNMVQFLRENPSRMPLSCKKLQTTQNASGALYCPLIKDERTSDALRACACKRNDVLREKNLPFPSGFSNFPVVFSQSIKQTMVRPPEPAAAAAAAPASRKRPHIELSMGV